MIPKKEPTLLSSYWKNSAVDYADWFSSRYPEIDYDTCAKVGAYIEGLVKAILENADELNSADSLRQDNADLYAQLEAALYKNRK